MIAKENSEMIRKTKVEMYLDILNVLDKCDMLKLKVIKNETNLCCRILREHLNFLLSQGLIEVKIFRRKNKVYSITQLGLSVLTQFKAIAETVPIVMEANDIFRVQEPNLSLLERCER